MNGGELFLGGMAAFALLTIALKAQSGARRARAAADIRPHRHQRGITAWTRADHRTSDRRRAMAGDHPPVQPHAVLGDTRATGADGLLHADQGPDRVRDPSTPQGWSAMTRSRRPTVLVRDPRARPVGQQGMDIFDLR